MDIGVLLGIAIIGAATYLTVSALRSRKKQAPDPEPAQADKPVRAEDLPELATRIEPVIEKMAHPSEILENDDFRNAVAFLASEETSMQQAGNYALGANWILSCVGFEALSQRGDAAELVDKAMRAVASMYAWPLYFLLRFLRSQPEQTVAGRLLCSVQYWWRNNPAVVDQVGEFLEHAIANGDPIVFDDQYAELDTEEKGELNEFIKALPESLQSTLRRSIEQHAVAAINWSFLKSIGVILNRGNLDSPFFDTAETRRVLAELVEELDSGTPRSMLLVGKSGVGKSAIIRAFSGRLLDRGWTVLQTSAAALIADKAYVGQIEGQIRRLVENATTRKKVVLYIESMAEIRQLGRYKGHDSSILDQLWPSIESRKILLVGETTQPGLQALLRDQPSLATTMRVATVNPASEAETVDVASMLLSHLDGTDERETSGDVVRESLQLAQQYLSHKSLPGSVLSLVSLAELQARQDEAARGVNRDHVLGALSQVSGLPRDVLDERQTLDIEGLAQSFKSRIIGQDEAVDCLVERIAMLKAGLTDPGRPIGVFLFAGPTGTGKTEIAKTLAELLFGSAEQMIRLDMSEFQDPDSGWRLIGRNDRGAGGGSLTSRIREHPFSVILLDEFEKAHVKVWDLFLQVFDDGRLSDTDGQLADFRHAIIILTSNLGATISNEAGVGFTSTSGGFSAKDVMRSVSRTFRREFVNRLDRVVVFRPLSREVMRAILENELNNALGRRGLRTKQWAVEWEDSAIEFLLVEGFTPDLGARPLRRAIERHLLAPLSITMVQNQVPSGEQFLFVRSDGDALQVEFIDPDAEVGEAPASAGTAQAPADLGLPALIAANSLPAGASDLLVDEMAAVAGRVGHEDWISNKSDTLAVLNEDGFWQRDDRFEVLDRIELIDRLDSAASILASLSERLQRNAENTKLIRSVANRLYVLNEGFIDLDRNRPTQCWLGLRLVTADAGVSGAQAFLDRLTDMYRNWARARGMRLRELDSGSGRYERLFSISGFGSFGLLEEEAGLHVFEQPAGETRFDRIRARVEVCGIPVTAPGRKDDQGARAAAELDAEAGKVEIVRRYRELPSPLARDTARGWRTGRLDYVFDGNFDILNASGD